MIMDIGKSIKVLRTAAGFSQRDFAMRAGMSAAGLSLIETGRREPTLSHLKGVSRALGVPISVLFHSSDEDCPGLSPELRADYARIQVLFAELVRHYLTQGATIDEQPR